MLIRIRGSASGKTDPAPDQALGQRFPRVLISPVMFSLVYISVFKEVPILNYYKL